MLVGPADETAFAAADEARHGRRRTVDLGIIRAFGCEGCLPRTLRVAQRGPEHRNPRSAPHRCSSVVNHNSDFASPPGRIRSTVGLEGRNCSARTK